MAGVLGGAQLVSERPFHQRLGLGRGEGLRLRRIWPRKKKSEREENRHKAVHKYKFSEHGPPVEQSGTS